MSKRMTKRDAVVAFIGADAFSMLLGAWANGLLGLDPREMTPAEAHLAHVVLVQGSFK